jgi:hypothetical protein
MPQPQTKQELADWILRKLGAPVINVEIADIQLEDAIDDAVQYFQQYHFDGSSRSYRTVKVSADLLAGNDRRPQNINAQYYDPSANYFIGDRVMTKVDGKKGYHIYVKVDSDTDLSFDSEFMLEDTVLNQDLYDFSREGQIGITIPDNIIGINKVFRVTAAQTLGMWNYEYQFFMTNFDWFYGSGGMGGMPMTNYYITKQNLDFIDSMINTEPAVRFNKHQNKLWIDFSWKQKAKLDQYFLVEVYEAADPEVWGDVYNDIWLKKYAAALAKMQWGSNLKKYTNTELPGGITLDGQTLYLEGKEEKDALEEEMKASLTLEMDFLVG